jgi:mannose-6-phosphate isomerase
MKTTVLPFEDIIVQYQSRPSKLPEDIPPFKIMPVFKDYIWGGSLLITDFGKHTALSRVAESWELSTHSDGESIVDSGTHKGMRLSQLLSKRPDLCGGICEGGNFPVLIKLIDAKDSLSIQVHPNDTYAWKVEGEPGKTEVWIILDCKEDAFVYYGFKKSISKEELNKYINSDTLPEVLYKRPVKRGDVIYIPAGTVHAIGAGIVLAEIQQNSNSTYRIYDFKRLGQDGRPRPLHIKKALDVISLDTADNAVPGKRLLAVTYEYALEQLVSCSFFTVQRLTLEGRFIYSLNQNSFAALLCIDGATVIESESETLCISKGDCVFVPKTQKGIFMKGSAKLLIITK